MKSKIISTLIENPDWYQSLVSQGVPLDPDQGEQIQQCAEKIADILEYQGFIGPISEEQFARTYSLACFRISSYALRKAILSSNGHTDMLVQAAGQALSDLEYILQEEHDREQRSEEE